DLTIPIVSPDEAGTLAAQAWSEGFRHLKIKVGDAQGHEADVARVEAILRAVPQIILRIDANQAFAPDQAVAFTKTLLSLGAAIEMLEQPTPQDDLTGLKYVKDHVDIPVFADESARSVPEVLRLLRDDGVDGINVKLMKSGLTGALQIVALCRAAGKKLMMGCMLESGLGIAAAAQMAGGLGVFDFLDLDSHRLLSPIAGLSGGFGCDENRLRVGQSEQPGWGVQVPEPNAEK
ncbi:MAG: dipeptide epimerase, partial [Armatimonadota bacterium]|nr:dipeptide epimerase [Armatimonadota bacterium]